MPDLPPVVLPPASLGRHAELIEKSLPDWVKDATPARRAALKHASAAQPDWLRQATGAQRQSLSDAAVAGFTAQSQLDKAMAGLQDVDTFAEPLLVKALERQFNVRLDVHKTLLRLNKPVEVGVQRIEISHYEAMRLSLLQAALHNFEADESEPFAFHETSGFLGETAPGVYAPISTALTVNQFIGLCRSLDIGSQYQTYLKAFLYPSEGVASQALRDKFCAAQKTALAAASHLALLKKDIEPADHAMILSVVNGTVHPRLGGKSVWFRDLTLMKHRLTGCVVFTIVDQGSYGNELILYIPNDPHAPLKRHTWTSMRAWFKQRFTTRAADDPTDGRPGAYARFFSRFVAYADRADYFSQLTQQDPDHSGTGRVVSSLLKDALKGFNPFDMFTSIQNEPPKPPLPRVPNPDPWLAPNTAVRKGHGLWAANIELWGYLYDRHREQILADARSHAVPTADVDARVRAEKFSRLLNISMLLLNSVSMLVPGLGEVMMGVMVSQLLLETFEGVAEWAEGDTRAATAHLVDVAENVALLAVMAGAPKTLAKLPSVKPVPLIEGLEPVTRADGKVRLWKPGLEGYDNPAYLSPDAGPSELGQYRQNGKTFIRHEGKAYEKTFDDAEQRWRIQHPTDADAYSPLLRHNGAGAWRYDGERPQDWDRLTLLRRVGHLTDGLSDEQLLNVGEISGTTDGALRQMHLDNAPPPPELVDTLRLFKADQGVANVIEQVQSGQGLDEHYLYILPLVTEMPRWPKGRVLQVFDGPQLSGPSVKYGSERWVPRALRKPAIAITRADVLGSQLPARILGALDESEINALLGGEPARVASTRPQEFRKQIADYARTRQPALFESLYTGNGVKDPLVAKVQRLYPGLSEPAAQAVLAGADPAQLSHLRATGRLPLPLQEQARWYVRHGRLLHAYAGLHRENLASASSRRLALHSLERLPGWSRDVRLEVRDGHPEGPLLDAIGEPNAAQRKYLVKQGPSFQAFNERGEALNSLSGDDDNFYASILHALPDQARRDLGIPHTGQSAQLRRAIIAQAQAHPGESAAWVDVQPTQRGFRPPQKVSQKLIGYPASGRGEGQMGSLVSRTRDVYPWLSEEQARDYVMARTRDGQTERQIFTHLNNRQREWLTLQDTLSRWEAEEPVNQLTAITGRRQAGEALRASWRGSPLPDLARRAELNLFTDIPLPALEADFSHVRTLTLGGRGITDANFATVLGYFPQVDSLTVAINHPNLQRAPQALIRVPGLTRLNIVASVPFDAAQVAHLEGLSGLQALTLDGALPLGRALDVSGMPQLRSLTLNRYHQTTLPNGVLDLPHLERLDLRGANINTLPGALYEPGHEQLWRGLSLDWSQFERGEFTRAYDYVRAQPEHLVSQEEMVNDYSRGQLLRVSRTGIGYDFDLPVARGGELSREFLSHWNDVQQTWQAIEALSSEHELMSHSLDTWIADGGPSMEVMHRVNVASRLRAAWADGLSQRWGASSYARTLDLSRSRLSRFPQLPERGFAHVQTLDLGGSTLPNAQLMGFVNRFSGLRSLSLRGTHLERLSLSPGEWAGIQHLDLSSTPLQQLDVTTLTDLRSLDLHDTPLETWPTGTENQAQLAWLDLRNTRLTTLPASALASDNLVLVSNLAGAPLTAEAEGALAQARQRVELARGLSPGTLDAFALQPVEETFPPQRTPLSIAEHLLAIEAGDPGLETLTRQLNSWLFIREVRGTNWAVSAQTRRQAALRIIQAWRGDTTLSLERLQVGDLPALPGTLPHVTDLYLDGVRLSEEGSNGFLGAFTQVRELSLNSNFLTELPEAVEHMTALQGLSLSGNGLADAEGLRQSLARLPGLQRLVLSQNWLETFSVQGLNELRVLDLSSNRLHTWPEGSLQAPALQRMDLSNNSIRTIPAEALDGSHDALMVYVDLSDNPELSQESLVRLEDYATSGGRNGALGMTRHEIDQMFDNSEGEGEDSDSPQAQPDEVLPEPAPLDEQSAPWLADLPQAQQAQYRQLWQQLEAEPGSERFFHLLTRLQETEEYRLARGDLSHRVRNVLLAASDSSELRQQVFANSASHGTCIDGRMVTFSDLETQVYVHNAERTIDTSRLDQRGPALLHLSRQLFRLEQVENLARTAARQGMDEAEVRLEYRIGLRDALDLPAQPSFMRFGRPLTGARQAEALRAVQAAERSDAFYEFLVGHDYWVKYLREKYPKQFKALDDAHEARRVAFGDAHMTLDERYVEAARMLDIELSIERNQRMIALSRLETGEAAPPARDPNQPGTSGT